MTRDMVSGRHDLLMIPREPCLLGTEKRSFPSPEGRCFNHGPSSSTAAAPVILSSPSGGDVADGSIDQKRNGVWEE